MDERLAPGMEDDEEPEPRTEMLRVQGDLLKRLGHRPHQEIVQDALVLKHERREHLRHCEDHVRVGHRKYVGLACFEPCRLGAALTLRAVTVPARVVRDLAVSTRVTRIDVTTEPRSPAGKDRRNDRTLFPTPGGFSARTAKDLEVPPKDLSDLVPRSLSHLLGGEQFLAQRIQRTSRRAQVLRRHMRVDLRRPERTVTQQRLDHS